MSNAVRTWICGLGLWLVTLLALALGGRLAGREPDAAWICGDTRYTRLVPQGRGVVGAPVSPPPGCLP